MYAQYFDIRNLQLTGEPKKLAEPDGKTIAFGYFGASPNVLVHRSGLGEMNKLTWVDRTGKTLGFMDAPFSYNSRPRISPDGSRAVLSKFANGNVHLFVHDIVRDVSQQVTSDPAISVDPVWSSDGKRIIF